MAMVVGVNVVLKSFCKGFERLPRARHFSNNHHFLFTLITKYILQVKYIDFVVIVYINVDTNVCE